MGTRKGGRYIKVWFCDVISVFKIRWLSIYSVTEDYYLLFMVYTIYCVLLNKFFYQDHMNIENLAH